MSVSFYNSHLKLFLNDKASSTCFLSSFSAFAFVCRWYKNSSGVFPTAVFIL